LEDRTRSVHVYRFVLLGKPKKMDRWVTDLPRSGVRL
jgi:hypothetical protein